MHPYTMIHSRSFYLASVYCQPSLYEGFGLPIIDAMACGTPVVASRISAHKEVAGSACEYFNPNSVDDMAKKLRSVINNKKKKIELSKKGLNQVSYYSWEKTAKKMIDVYKKVYKV